LRLLICVCVLKQSHLLFEEESGGRETRADGRETRADGRSNRLESSGKDEEQQRPMRQDGVVVGNDEVTIRTYAGLSATTRERIRRCVLL
jgi:hypothetical protein